MVVSALHPGTVAAAEEMVVDRKVRVAGAQDHSALPAEPAVLVGVERCQHRFVGTQPLDDTVDTVEGCVGFVLPMLCSAERSTPAILATCFASVHN